VSWYQKGRTNVDFTEAKDSELQWHQLGCMQVYTSLQTDNHASTPPQFFTGRMPFLLSNQQRQSTEDTYKGVNIVSGNSYVITLTRVLFSKSIWVCPSDKGVNAAKFLLSRPIKKSHTHTHSTSEVASVQTSLMECPVKPKT